MDGEWRGARERGVQQETASILASNAMKITSEFFDNYLPSTIYFLLQ